MNNENNQNNNSWASQFYNDPEDMNKVEQPVQQSAPQVAPVQQLEPVQPVQQSEPVQPVVTPVEPVQNQNDFIMGPVTEPVPNKEYPTFEEDKKSGLSDSSLRLIGIAIIFAVVVAPFIKNVFSFMNKNDNRQQSTPNANEVYSDNNTSDNNDTSNNQDGPQESSPQDTPAQTEDPAPVDNGYQNEPAAREHLSTLCSEVNSNGDNYKHMDLNQTNDIEYVLDNADYCTGYTCVYTIDNYMYGMNCNGNQFRKLSKDDMRINISLQMASLSRDSNCNYSDGDITCSKGKCSTTVNSRNYYQKC